MTYCRKFCCNANNATTEESEVCQTYNIFIIDFATIYVLMNPIQKIN